MAVTKISNSGILTGTKKYDSMLAGNAAYDPAATWLIERVNATGSSNTVTFSNIPQTYKHLQLRIISRSDFPSSSSIVNIRIRPNGDTSTNYAGHNLTGSGTAVTAAGSTGNSYLDVYRLLPLSSNTANVFGVGIVDIHDYTSTTNNKTVRSFSGTDVNGTGFVSLGSGLWINTSAITSLTLLIGNGNFVTGTSFALYGFIGA